MFDGKCPRFHRHRIGRGAVVAFFVSRLCLWLSEMLPMGTLTMKSVSAAVSAAAH